MSTVVVGAAMLLAVVASYVFVLRPKLKECPWFEPFYGWIEPIEAHLWAKSRTVFLARLVWVPGAILTVHDFILPMLGLIDWNPITTAYLLKAGVPEQFHAATMVAATTLLSQAFDWLRHLTDRSLSDKE